MTPGSSPTLCDLRERVRGFLDSRLDPMRGAESMTRSANKEANQCQR